MAFAKMPSGIHWRRPESALRPRAQKKAIQRWSICSWVRALTLVHWSPACRFWRTRLSDYRERHVCNRCHRRGTAYRCSHGCDYDLCELCYGEIREQMDQPSAFSEATRIRGDTRTLRIAEWRFKNCKNSWKRCQIVNLALVGQSGTFSNCFCKS